MPFHTRGYSATDDLHVFIAEAMALLRWGMQFKLDPPPMTASGPRGTGAKSAGK
jgi:hypothetical protein